MPDDSFKKLPKLGKKYFGPLKYISAKFRIKIK